MLTGKRSDQRAQSGCDPVPLIRDSLYVTGFDGDHQVEVAELVHLPSGEGAGGSNADESLVGSQEAKRAIEERRVCERDLCGTHEDLGQVAELVFDPKRCLPSRLGV